MKFKGVYSNALLGYYEAQQAACNDAEDTFKRVESYVVPLAAFKDYL
jgi:hypothetical protein